MSRNSPARRRIRRARRQILTHLLAVLLAPALIWRREPRREAWRR